MKPITMSPDRMREIAGMVAPRNANSENPVALLVSNYQEGGKFNARKFLDEMNVAAGQLGIPQVEMEAFCTAATFEHLAR